MAYIGRSDELDANDLEAAQRKLLTALDGVSSTVAANACLRIAIAICLRGGVTKDQILQVVRAILAHIPGERSN